MISEDSGKPRPIVGPARSRVPVFLYPILPCDLYREATQTVFGEGGPSADIVFIGEQPGDQEDKVGRPFVGLAGHILDEALRAVGIDRSKCYVTNAVKLVSVSAFAWSVGLSWGKAQALSLATQFRSSEYKRLGLCPPLTR